MINNTELIKSLYDKITDERIFMYSVDTGEEKAITIKDNNTLQCGIFFDYNNFKNTEEEFCVIVHEYGHCKTGCTHKLDSPYQLIEQHEYRANRAAVHDFLPYDVLKAAFKAGCTEPWQIAEYLDMPEEFVRLAVEIYIREGKI